MILAVIQNFRAVESEKSVQLGNVLGQLGSFQRQSTKLSIRGGSWGQFGY